MPHADRETARRYMREYYKKNKVTLDAYKQEWIKNNPDQHLEHQERYRDKSKEKRQAWQRKYLYGLDHEAFLKMLEDQKHCCALCSESFEKKKIFVDHCHSTGDVRGLLCPACNTALGLIKDDLKWLAKAKKYLTEK